MNKINRTKIQRLLGYAGLIPFIAIAVWRAVAGGGVDQPAVWLFTSYSAVILSFLAGTLWHSKSDQPNLLMVLSNVFAIGAWLAVALIDVNALLFLIVTYVALLIVEFKLAKHQVVGAYVNLRIILTTIVISLHIAMYFMNGA